VPSTRPELGFEEFHAKVAISVEFVEATSSIVLNSLRLRINKCHFRGESVAFHVELERQELVIDLGKVVAAAHRETCPLSMRVTSQPTRSESIRTAIRAESDAELERSLKCPKPEE
jgi:hypothetical protein